MIRVLLKKLLDEKTFRERRRITLHEVGDETGISRATLTRIANVPGYNTNTDTINALCRYFDCTLNDLVVYIPDEPKAKKKGKAH
jgi:putative transcriptional regulator